MKRLLLFLAFSGVCLAQNTGCFTATGSTYPCSMIPTVQEAQAVNTKVSAGAGVTITNAFAGATGKGNTIVCLGLESAAAIPVFTDADANTYAVVKSSATAPGYSIAVANNIAGTTSDVVTLTTTSGAAAFVCHELKGPVTVGQAWDLFDAQQATATTIAFNPTTASVPGEMVFAAAGFTTGQTVNATPALGGNNTSLVTVDAANTAVTGGAALAVFYAAHTTLNAVTSFTQTMALSASVAFSGVLVSIKPPALTSAPAIATAASATLQNAATGNGNGTAMSVMGLSSAIMTVNCSVACTGGTTINFEGSEDNTNFAAINGQQMGTATIASTVLNQSTTATLWEVNVSNLQSFRARISGYSAGTITVTMHASAATFDPKVINSNLFVAGNAGTTGTGAGGSGIPRVTVSNDSSLAANQSINVSQYNGQTAVQAANGVAKVGIVGNANAAIDAATGAAPPANAVLVGGLISGATGGFVGTLPICDSYANINISTATTTLLVTGVSGRHVRICHIDMVALAADNVGIISGTGATCGTGTGAIVGTTAATGFNFSANGGIAAGSGLGTIMRTVATGDSVCLITSASTQLSGVIAYTIY